MIGKDDKKKNKGRDAEDVVSIVGPGMTITGDCETEGTLRIEGKVDGTIRSGKAVVIGEDGEVVGDIHTQDAVVAGRVEGSIQADSRIELKASARIEGDVRCRRVKLEEGGFVDGRIEMGGSEAGKRRPVGSPQSSPEKTPQDGEDG